MEAQAAAAQHVPEIIPQFTGVEVCCRPEC
jgi:hypothetical protein